jgi:hypothetical protein
VPGEEIDGKSALQQSGVAFSECCTAEFPPFFSPGTGIA